MLLQIPNQKNFIYLKETSLLTAKSKSYLIRTSSTSVINDKLFVPLDIYKLAILLKTMGITETSNLPKSLSFEQSFGEDAR